MVYALNLFNFREGKENDYREYSVKAGKIIYGKGKVKLNKKFYFVSLFYFS